jgi:hypothetical protein
MMNPVAAIVAMAMIAYPVVAQTGVTISAVNCPNDPTDLMGYTSLAALNSDMQLELQRIANGGAPVPPYTFTLCPNQVFDATLVTLLPVLSDSTFVCGANGDPEDDCTLLGGEEQIRIEDSTVNGYLLENLAFVGLSFADFSNSDEMLGSSIAALASSTTTATFMNNRWSVSFRSTSPMIDVSILLWLTLLFPALFRLSRVILSSGRRTMSPPL